MCTSRFLWYGADMPNPNLDLYAMAKKPQVHNFISLAILKSGQQTIISLHFWSQSSSCRTLNWVSLTNFCLPRQITLVWLQRWGAEGFVSNLVFDHLYLLSLVSDALNFPSATMTKGSQELPWIVDTWVIQLAWVSRQLQTITIEIITFRLIILFKLRDLDFWKYPLVGIVKRFFAFQLEIFTLSLRL